MSPGAHVAGQRKRFFDSASVAALFRDWRVEACEEKWIDRYRDSLGLDERLASWGYVPTGTLVKSHATDRDLTRKMVWFDVPM